MSLINDALRKAQAQQQPSPQAAAQENPALSVEAPRRRVGLYIGIGVAGSFFSIVVAVVLYLLFVNYQIDSLLRSPPAQAPVAAAPEAISTVEPAPIHKEAAPVEQESLPGEEQHTEAGAEGQAGETELVEETRDAVESTLELQAWIDAIQVRGVMTGAGKVLLYLPAEDYTAAFSTGQAIDKEGRLSLQQIFPNKLVFKDNGGHEYIRRF